MSVPRYVYETRKVGDALDPYQHQVLQLNASVWVGRDISAMTGYRFIMKTRQGATVIDEACTLPDAVNGWMQYQLTAGDIAALSAGHFLIEWTGTIAGVPYVSPTIHQELEARI